MSDFQYKDPLHPTDEERREATLRLRLAKAKRNRGTEIKASPTPGMRSLGDLAGDLGEELRRRMHSRRAQEAAELAARRAAFTGDCSWCFDQGPCTHCQRGQIVAEELRIAAEHAEGQRRRDACMDILGRANIPPRRFTESFDSFPYPRLPAFRRMVDFVATWDGQRGLMLTGIKGSGKTGLAVSGMREIAPRWVDTTHRMLFMKAPDLMDALRSGYNDHSYDDRLDVVRNIRLLVIDDLGAERSNEWQQEQLFMIVDHRYEHYLPTWITTNYDRPTGLGDRIGERTLDRLIESCERIDVKGPNLRRTKQ